MSGIPVLSYRRAGAKRSREQGSWGGAAGKSARSYLTHCAIATQSRRAHPPVSRLYRGPGALLLSAFLLASGAAAGAESAVPPAPTSTSTSAPAREPSQEPAKEPAQDKVSASKAHIIGTDITPQFDALYNGPDAKALLSARQKAALQRYDVLLVPGFLTGFYLQIGKFVERTIDKKDVLNYLREAHEALGELGLKTEQVFLDREQFNTQASVAVNAERIAQAIQRSAEKGKRVILVSHSKGGNDVLAALLKLQRERKLSQVAGWVSVQAGFMGTPIADQIMDNEALRTGAKLFIEGLGGTIESLSDMTSAACKKTLADHAQETRKLIKSVPIISFASWKPRPDDFQLLHPDTILAQTRDLMASHGLNNDGLVPMTSAVLPGSAYVAKLGIDHSEVAMANQPPVLASKVDRKKFLNILLAMLLKRLPGTAGQRQK